MVAAGPLSEIVMLLSAWFLWVPVLVWFGLTLETAEQWRGPVCLYFVYTLIVVSYPHETTYNKRKIPNDGLQLWQDLTDKTAAAPSQGLDPSISWFWVLWQNDEKEMARLHLMKTEKKWALQSPEVRVQAAALYSEIELPDRARNLFSLAKRELPSGSDSLADCLDGWACLSVYHNRSEWLEEAKAVIEEAIHLYPAKVTFLGTYGGILAELGRDEEAAKHLQKLIDASEAEIDQCISHAYLAWMAARQGDHEMAAVHAGKAGEVREGHKLAKRKLEEMKAILAGATTQTAM